MPINFIALAAGIIVAVMVIIQLKRLKPENTAWIYPLILATLPIYYWVFAIYAANLNALLNEALLGSVFIVMALLSYRLLNSLGQAVLGVGFVVHALYDIAHVTLSNNTVAPIWWPEFCGAVDMIIGIYLLWSLKGQSLKVLFGDKSA